MMNADYVQSTGMKLNLDPGKGAGPFIIGSDVRDVLNTLSTLPWSDVVRQTTIKYDRGLKRDSDILFDLTENGVLLRFSHETQKLKSVEIYAFRSLQLFFCGMSFSGSSPQPQMYDSISFRDAYSGNGVAKVPTFAEIYGLFRPTYPGKYNFSPDRITYTLKYPGITFIFTIPETWRELARQLESRRDHPIEFPDKTSPLVERISVSQPADEDGKVLASSPSTGDLMDSMMASSGGEEEFKKKAEVRKQNVTVKLLDGLYFSDGSSIRFGDSVQDVLATLGEPDDKFVKQTGRMKNQARSSQISSSGAAPPDVFYNYFSSGIDVLIDGKTFTVKKFVLHSNFPHHKDFGRYSKSIWRSVVCPLGAEEEAGREINVDFTWPEIRAAFAPCETSGEPLVNSASSAESPFGTTFYHAYEQYCTIFEVTGNDFIASLTFFSR